MGGLIEFGPRVAGAQAVLRAVSEAPARRTLTAWHCCLEFYAVATRLPEEFRLSPADAGRLVEEELLGRLQIVDLPRSARLELVREAIRERIAGGRLYDAHIAEIARRSGARLVVTDNVRHFSGLRAWGIRVVDSAASAADLAGARGRYLAAGRAAAATRENGIPAWARATRPGSSLRAAPSASGGSARPSSAGGRG